MVSTRIIPCLDTRNGRVVKGIRFQGLRDAGSPVELAERYEADGADELVLLDVSATAEGRGHALDTVRAVRAVLAIPLTVGGAVRTLDDAGRLLDAGADKVAINSAALDRPALLGELATRYGSQCVTLSIDAARSADGWQVFRRAGKDATGRDARDWAREGVTAGAGEVLLTSIDRDGTRDGYDLDLIRAVRALVNVPIVASGGARNATDLLDAVHVGADAVLAASLFHDGDATVLDIKTALRNAGLEIRL